MLNIFFWQLKPKKLLNRHRNHCTHKKTQLISNRQNYYTQNGESNNILLQLDWFEHVQFIVMA